MRLLVFGSSGFVGKSLVAELEKDHQVWKAVRGVPRDVRTLSVDLLDSDTVERSIIISKPEVIINAAGIVDNTEESVSNLTFTQNIMGAIVASKLVTVPKVVICGSAAEYGYVDPDNIPVSESCPTMPFSLYGENKHKETEYALSYGRDNGIEVVVARIFNPIGGGMAGRFLIPRLIEQIEALDSDIGTIEISRKDSERDYVDVRDLASAISLLCINKTRHSVYNIGSGVGTTNLQLVEVLLRHIAPEKNASITETSIEPERQIASRANISRIRGEFGWKPQYTIDDTIKELIDAKA